MFNVIFQGFKTKEQAEEFILWYDCQGERNAIPYFEEKKLPVPIIHAKTTYPIQSRCLIQCKPDETLIVNLQDGEWHK